MSLNTVVLDGRLVKDAEVRTGQSGKPYTNFRIAHSRWNPSKGEEETSFINIRSFKEMPFKKGVMVILKGELEIRQYDKDGEKKEYVLILAREVYPVTYMKRADAFASSPSSQQSSGYEQAASVDKVLGSGFEDDDIPF